MEGLLEGSKIVIDLVHGQYNQANDSVDTTQNGRLSAPHGVQTDTPDDLFNSGRELPATTPFDSNPRSQENVEHERFIHNSEGRHVGEGHVQREYRVWNYENDDGSLDLRNEGGWITGEVEIIPAEVTTRRRRSPATPTRNLPISSPCVLIDSFTFRNVELYPQVNVELHDGDFMRAINIIHNLEDDTITLRGWIFRRNSLMEGNMEMKADELCWVLQIEEDDPRSYKVQGMETRSVENVYRQRRIRLTNRPCDDLSWKEDPAKKRNGAASGPELVCRLKYISVYENAVARGKNNAPERVYQRLRAEECDQLFGMRNEPNAVVDDILCIVWRGENMKGGACLEWLHGENEFLASEDDDHRAGENPRFNAPRGHLESSMNRGNVAKLVKDSHVGVQLWQPAEIAERQAVGLPYYSIFNRPPTSLPQWLESVDLTGDTHPKIGKRSLTATAEVEGRKAKSSKLSHKPNTIHPWSIPAACHERRYTFGDAFCGAGGTSRGAVMAGLRVKWGFDFELKACNSYALNFYGATVYNLAADQFLSLPDPNQHLRVDVLHLSPPCCPYSRAHTTPGKNDEINQAALFAVGPLLDKARPRIATLEEVDGLTLEKHKGFFTALIQMFTAREYSLRWKIFNLADFGLSQQRKRILMIASAPGEVLPPFPKLTHSNDPGRTGLKPWVPMSRAIGRIPDNWDLHDIAVTRPREASPVLGVGRTMTTSGAGITHPDGKRTPTFREYACLQGFPIEHKFGRVALKVQMGNAVPPSVGEILLKEITTALKKADRLNE